MVVETQFYAAILDEEFALIPKCWQKPVSYGIPCMRDLVIGCYFRLQFQIKVETLFDAAISDEEFALIPEWI